MTITAEVLLKKTRIRFDAPDFSLNLIWDERNPMADVMAYPAGIPAPLPNRSRMCIWKGPAM
ncbi:MAG: hypothetical protein WAV22_00705 [Porticoccaceae bacterium]